MPSRPRRLLRWVILALGVGFFIAVFSVDVTEKTIWVDAVTGSIERRSEGRFGGTPTAVKEVSSLEVRFEKMGMKWVPAWRCISCYRATLMDMRTPQGHGRAPAVYHLGQGLKEFVERSNDTEIRTFVDVMANGSEEEQRAAVEAASDKGFANLVNPADNLGQKTKALSTPTSR